MLAAPRLEETRTRLVWTMFAGNAIATTGYIGLATVNPLVAEEITGSKTLAGLPATTATLGIAVGAAALSWLSLRLGRRATFAFGYLIAFLGSILVVFSVATSSFALLLLGMLSVGIGRSVGQLARYAAGDLRSEDRRASAISLIIWASTIGAVVGPLLIGPTGAFASAAGFDELVGPIAVAVGGYALVSTLMFVGLRPDPLSVSIDDHASEEAGQARPLRDLLAIPSVQLALVAIIVSQVVMVLVMVMTPIHITDNDGSLATVGWVMMAHTLGMFALAPVTGRLVDRFGQRKMIITAVAVFIVSCALAALAVTANLVILIVGLFGLGLAWNFGFVAGSTLVQQDQPLADRVRLQGFTDSAAWISSGIAASASGVVLAATSYTVLALAGALLALIPLIGIRRVRHAT